MENNFASATSTIQTSLSYKLTNYFRQRWLYQTIIGNVKRQVKKEIAENLQMEEQERINKILESTIRRVRGGEKPEATVQLEIRQQEKPKRKTRERQMQNGNGDYTVIGAAKYLGIGESTLRKYMSEEKIKSEFVGTKRFFKQQELERFKKTPLNSREIEQEVEKTILKENTDEK